MNCKARLLFINIFINIAFLIAAYNSECGLRYTSLPTNSLDRSLLRNNFQLSEIGDTVVFNIQNIQSGNYESIDFLYYSSIGNTRLFVELSEINSENIDILSLEYIINAFESNTPHITAGDTGELGIRYIAEEILGVSPGGYYGSDPAPSYYYDYRVNNAIVNIVIFDIRDGFSSTGSYTAGFFDPVDQLINSDNGNYGNNIYIDSNPSIINQDNINKTLFTLAHEYQHLLHWIIDPCEGNFPLKPLPNQTLTEYQEMLDDIQYFFSCTPHNKWLNEGVSDFMGYYLTGEHRDFHYYLDDMTIELDGWPERCESDEDACEEESALPYYSKSSLFFHYLYENNSCNAPLDVITNIVGNRELQGISSITNECINNSLNSIYKDFVQTTIMDEYADFILPKAQGNYFIPSAASEEYDILMNIDIGSYATYNIIFPSNLSITSASSSSPQNTLIITNNTPYTFDDSEDLNDAESQIHNLNIDDISLIGGGYYTKISFAEPIDVIDETISFRVFNQQIYAYPNPLHGDILNILIFPKHSSIPMIDFFDLRGRKVHSIQTNNQQYIEWNIPSNYASGVYFIGYRVGDGNFFNKVTISR